MTSDTSPDAACAGAPYHHGDLPNALRRAAADVLAERGVAGFSLREVARRAGVSHAAPAHHYGDAAGLLTSVAVEAFDTLAARTGAAAAAHDDPVEALAAVGRAYVSVAQAFPGHAAVVFRHDVVRAGDPALEEAGQRAFQVLVGTLERLAAERNPDLDVQLAAGLCWSMVQGLLTVHDPLSRMAEGAGTALPEIGDLAAAFTGLLVGGLAPDA